MGHSDQKESTDMKKIAVAGFLVAALGAGFAGSWIQGSFPEVQPVHAQDRSKDGGVRIGLLNLEKASRESDLFATKKTEWEAIQEEMKKRNTAQAELFRKKEAEFKRRKLEGESMDDLLDLQVEIAALKTSMEYEQEEQKRYLGALLNLYQDEVLRVVIHEAKEIAKKAGLDIVLQDYTVEAGKEMDYFGGGSTAGTLMSKPVLITPGLEDNKNKYVVDITEQVIRAVKKKG